MKIRLTQPQVELEAWAELGNNLLFTIQTLNILIAGLHVKCFKLPIVGNRFP